MEMKFNETTVGCMESLISQRQQQEQTLEMRLPDGMPDAGRILGVWGQPVIRGKEWGTGSIGVSGGIMVWVLYAPEDGTAPRSMEGWMPFQMQWDVPDHGSDGFICIEPRMKNMDARCVSPRKIMVRGTVSIGADAMSRCTKTLYSPDAIPEDIQILRRSYPMEMVMECGEKTFQLDEDIIIPGNYPTVGKIVRYDVQADVTEQRIMAGRLVFRGVCRIHMLYSSDDGMLNAWDQEIPISQYADLDNEYSNHADADFVLIPSGMELDKLEDGKLLFKCSIIAQYMIYDRVMVDIIEDAYSPCRELNLHFDTLDLPVRLEERKDRFTYTKNAQTQGKRVVDHAIMWDHGNIRQNGDTVGCEFQLHHQLLTYDENDNLHCASIRGNEDWAMPSDDMNRVNLRPRPESPMISFDEDAVNLSAGMEMTVSVFSQRGMDVITAIEYGEKTQPDPQRPSLILRKAGDERLWDIAKECRSTVDAIKRANKLTEEPKYDQMLLVPVY